jgi:hypothetical protein
MSSLLSLHHFLLLFSIFRLDVRLNLIIRHPSVVGNAKRLVISILDVSKQLDVETAVRLGTLQLTVLTPLAAEHVRLLIDRILFAALGGNRKTG